MHPSVALPKIIEIAGNSNVFPTVLDDLVDLAESPPFERLHTVSDFALAEGRRYDAVELRSETEALLEIVLGQCVQGGEDPS